MKLLQFTLSAIALCVFAKASPYDLEPVRSYQVNKLLSDYLDLYYRAIKQEKSVYPGSFKTFYVQTKDVDVKIDVSNGKQSVGESLSQFQSSSVTENEFYAELAATQGKTVFEGEIEIKGTVKGQSIDKTGNISIAIGTLTPEFVLKATHTVTDLVLEDYNIMLNYSKPEVDLDIEFEDKELIADAIIGQIMKEADIIIEEFKRNKKQYIQYVNQMLERSHITLEMLHQMCKDFLAYAEAMIFPKHNSSI